MLGLVDVLIAISTGFPSRHLDPDLEPYEILYSINLVIVTRLRSSHISSGDNFLKMGWNLDPRCGCGTEMRTHPILFIEWPLISEARLGFFNFLKWPGWPSPSPFCLRAGADRLRGTLPSLYLDSARACDHDAFYPSLLLEASDHYLTTKLCDY